MFALVESFPLAQRWHLDIRCRSKKNFNSGIFLKDLWSILTPNHVSHQWLSQTIILGNVDPRMVMTNHTISGGSFPLLLSSVISFCSEPCPSKWLAVHQNIQFLPVDTYASWARSILTSAYGPHSSIGLYINCRPILTLVFTPSFGYWPPKKLLYGPITSPL